MVLVWKKDGGLRFCIDLRKLNEWTIKDTYSLPQIDETLDSLQGSQWFSSLHLKSGYWQVEMDEESKPLTAFTVGPLGFYECKRMPFRLTNAPATFQRLMETCLGDLNISIGVSSIWMISWSSLRIWQVTSRDLRLSSGNWRRPVWNISLQNVSYSRWSWPI